MSFRHTVPLHGLFAPSTQGFKLGQTLVSSVCVHTQKPEVGTVCPPLSPSTSLLRLSGQDLPIAAFPVLGLQVCATAPAFHVGARQQTSGSPGLCSKRFADHVPSTVPGGFKLGLGCCAKDSNPTSNLLSGSSVGQWLVTYSPWGKRPRRG